MIQNFGGHILVNGLFQLNRASDPVALHPHELNVVQLCGIELELYCNPWFVPSNNLSSLIGDINLASVAGSQASSMQTSIATGVGSTGQVASTEAMYFLRNQVWPSHQSDKRCHTMAMDPRTCKKYVAKLYAHHDRAHLEARLQAFERIRVSVFPAPCDFGL